MTTYVTQLTSWKYLEGATGHTSGFEASAFNDAAWASGNQPFGKNDLSVTQAYVTSWAGSNNDMCLRAHLTLDATVTAITLTIRVDYSASVWVNGALIGTSDYSTVLGGTSFVLSSWNVGDNVIAIRAHSDAQQNHVELWVTSCDSPMVFDVFSLGTATSPGLSYLATLCDAFDKSFRVELDGTGSGRFSINRSSESATSAILGDGAGAVRYVQARIPSITTEAIAGFFIEEGDFRLLDADEDGGETLTFTGHGSLAYLDFAVMAAHSYLTTPFVGEDPFGGLWRLYLAGTGSKPGQILQRVLAEARSATRPQSPIPLQTDIFDYTDYDTDSNAAAWASSTATNEFSAQIGESVLSVIGRLIGTASITVQMSPYFVLGAYNTYGTDRSNATFAAGKVRFVAGTNIADGLSRQLRPSTVATHSIVYGESEVSAIAAISGFATKVTREVFVATTGSTSAALSAVGSADLAERLLRSDALTVRIILGADASTGLYLPWTSFWVGDTVTVYTGTGEYDYNNTSFRVAAINIVEPTAAVLSTDLEVTVELGSAGILEGSAPGSGLVSAGGGSSSVVPVHSHPSQVPWSYAKEHGLKGDGTTDDTAAFQAWITSVTASGTQSGWFFFEPGIYLIGGALQDTGAFNGQIVLPNVSTANPQITLTFQGAIRAPLHPVGTIPTTTSGYSVIKSSLTGGTGTAAVISGGNGTFPTKNNIQVNVKDLICLAPDNPSLTFWNLSTTQGGERSGLLITVVPWSTASEPTNTNAYGIKLPQWGQSNTSIHVGDIMVGGHYTGILQGELSIGVYVAGLCKVAVELPFTEHPSTILSLQQTACTIGIKVTGDHFADVQLYSSEHYTSPAWAVTTYDLSDPSNYLLGHIRWWGVAVGGVPDHVFLVNGATNAHYEEIGVLPAGTLIVKDEGTPLATAGSSLDFVGAGVVASGTGATKTITIAGGASFATPAIVLGTAAAAGAAATVIRSDSTIVAFDATVPVTQAFSDAAATGSAAVAARRDHTHGMPATPSASASYVVMVTGSVPPDPVLNSDGDDWVYSS